MKLGPKPSLMISKLVSVLILPVLAVTSLSIRAQEREWWFDIEVIVYKRNLSPDDISEQFSKGLNLPDTQNSISLLDDFIHPDLTYIRGVLPECFAPPVESDFPDFEYVYDKSLYTEIEFESLIPASPAEEDDAVTKDPVEADVAAMEDVVEADVTVIEDTVEAEVDVASNEQTNELIDETVDSLFSMPLSIPEWTPPRILEDHVCAYEPQENRQVFVESVPREIDSREWPHLKQPQLLSQSSLQLGELATDIRRKRGLSSLIHMGWRQQVFFGQDNSAALRLIAGKNYAKEFDLQGNPVVEPEEPESYSANGANVQDVTAQGVTAQGVIAGSIIPKEGAMNLDASLLADSNDGIIEQPMEPIDIVSRIQLALNEQNDVPSYQDLIKVLQQPVYSAEEAQQDNSIENQPQDLPQAKTELVDLWELDGNLKIFLRYLGRTPYLHIDGDLDFRAPVTELTVESNSQLGSTDGEPEQRLQSFDFKQLRRVISKQVHYFDHPFFGLIVQIRRYEFPPPEMEAQETDE